MSIMPKLQLTHSFVAQSGISHHTNTAHTQQANKNQIEEKTYYINVNDREESNLAEQFLVFIKNTIQKNTQQEDKGTQFFRLYESKDALYPLNQSDTTAYTLHTGNEYGDYKGIDLAKDKDNELTQNRKDSTKQSHTQTSQGFFHTLESLKQKYKDIVESLKDDRGRIMIKVDVGYELYEFAKYFTFDEIIQTSHREFVKRGNNLQSLKDLCQKILDKLQAHI